MADVLRPVLSNTYQERRPSNTLSYASVAQAHPQSQSSSQRSSEMPRNNQYSANSGYRGTSAAPAYAFKTTPTLRNDNRPNTTSSAPTNPPLSGDNSSAGNRQRYPAPASVSTTSSSNASSNNPSTTPSTNTNVSTWSSLFTKDDSVMSSNFQIPPFSTTTQTPLADSLSISNAPPTFADGPAKSSPDRYRRNQRRAESHNATGLQQPGGNAAGQTQPGQLGHSVQQNGVAKPPGKDNLAATSENLTESSNKTTVTEPQAIAGAAQPGASQNASSMRRYRRRSSAGTLDPAAKAAPADEETKVAPANPVPEARQPNRPASPINKTAAPSQRADGSTGPARTFAEVARRTNTPSPLSRPMTPSESPGKMPAPSSPPAGPPSAQSSAFQNSPAVAAMAALHERDDQKGVKSRLRRAFSFGSSAELRRATEGPPNAAADRAQARQQQFSSELDDEQDAIARQQEAAGLGNSIYSGQAGFTGSTDNLSISSTASSASMMLRKMGKGVKKGGRSIKGLFRPKSAIGVAPPDGPLGAGVGEISRVTVEAEREKVNVNVDPHDQQGGGTGFPKLERNSVDAVRASTNDRDLHHDGARDARQSIMGGETERAEVLASVKRSILKRSTTGSPTGSPSLRAADAPAVDQGTSLLDRRPSPVPSNTSSEPRRNAHRRTDSVTLDKHDYFASPANIANSSTRSLPTTPRGSSRNISFSPRLQFHDVWSATDYDRRGDIATCNRLTPMLAQQIKEELNTFKMEMEVHEASKPHTHFF